MCFHWHLGNYTIRYERRRNISRSILGAFGALASKKTTQKVELRYIKLYEHMYLGFKWHRIRVVYSIDKTP